MNIQKVLNNAIKRLKPTKKESQDVQHQVKNTIDLLTNGLKKIYSDIEVRVEGSIAKNTWLSNSKEIDIFLLLPLETPRELLQDVLSTVKKVIRTQWIERYAEHPFLEFSINEYKVEIVPCFKVLNSEQLKSAVDRTPYHTKYIRSKLRKKPELKNEIRLLKQFMKGTGVYGAEAKVMGFSGYLAELLVINCGSYENVIKESAKWKFGECIDPENLWENKKLLKHFFPHSELARYPRHLQF